MATLSSAFSYSIGKKLIMGLTGLFLISFLVVHLLGNLLLFVGEVEFNAYAEFMGHNLLIRTMEIVLFLGFIFHIVDGLMLAKKNAGARPVKYAVNSGTKNASWFSKNMPVTGIVLLVFLILHLISFWLKARIGVDISFGLDDSTYLVGDELNMYQKTVGLFSIPWYSILYVVSMAFIGFHLVHGFQSAFQTIGLNHKKYSPIIKAIGLGYAVLVPAAFASIPIYFLITA